MLSLCSRRNYIVISDSGTLASGLVASVLMCWLMAERIVRVRNFEKQPKHRLVVAGAARDAVHSESD